MKKLLILTMSILLLSGCFNSKEEQKRIVLVNNYNVIALPFLIPHSQPTTKQKIIIKNWINDEVNEIEVESNTDGLITRTIVNGESSVDVDYENTNLLITSDGETYHYKISFDDKYNIVNLIDSKDEIAVTTDFDKKGRAIKMSGEFIGKPKFEEYHYVGAQLKFHSNKNGKMVNNNFIGSLTETELLYNKENKLMQTIAKSYSVVNDKNWAYLPENENSKNNAYICSYSAHNQYGDWTKGECMNLDGENTAQMTRKLEY